MYKSSIFSHILAIVSEETEVSEELILSSCRQAEVVDARYILVRLLHEAGFYIRTIATLIHKTDKSVHHILSDFDNRKRYGKMLSINYEITRKELRNNFPTML